MDKEAQTRINQLESELQGYKDLVAERDAEYSHLEVINAGLNKEKEMFMRNADEHCKRADKVSAVLISIRNIIREWEAN